MTFSENTKVESTTNFYGIRLSCRKNCITIIIELMHDAWNYEIQSIRSCTQLCLRIYVMIKQLTNRKCLRR